MRRSIAALVSSSLDGLSVSLGRNSELSLSPACSVALLSIQSAFSPIESRMHQQRSFSAAPEPSEPSTSTPSESKVPEVYAHFLEQKNYKAPPLEFPVRHLRHYKPKPKSKYTYDPWPEGIEPIQTSELVPEGVTLTIERSISQQGKVGWLTVSGPLGSCNFSLAGTAIKIADGQVHLWGVERGRVLPLMSKIKGAFDGVRQGYVKGLQLQGIGYKVEQKASDTLEFRIGKSHPVTMVVPPDVRAIVVGNDKVYVTGVNKDAVGQAAAAIKRLHKVNVYTGKGIHDMGAEKDFKKKEFRKAGK